MKGQGAGITFALCIFCIMLLVLIFSGCMHGRNVKELNIAIPALFQYEMEFNEDRETALDVSAIPLDALPVEEIVPIFTNFKTLGIGGGVIAALSSVLLFLKRKKKNV
jgi:uncharacterized protein YegL